MEPRRAIWKDHNLRHITKDHPERGITQEDVDDVLADPNRHEVSDSSHGTVVAVGSTRGGDRLVVAFLELSDGSALPIHARRSGRATQ